MGFLLNQLLRNFLINAATFFAVKQAVGYAAVKNLFFVGDYLAQ